MSLRSAANDAGTLAVVVLVVVVGVGVITGQPLLLGFVDSGSMEPSLSPGEGFVILPPAMAGDLGPGDVIVYDAEELHGGGLITHRIVADSGEGFVTRGDANEFRDQARGEPPVKRAQVVGVAFQVNGGVVSIPHLGTLVTAVGALVRTLQTGLAQATGLSLFLQPQGLASLLFGAALLWYGYGAWFRERRHEQDRTPARETGWDVRLVLLALATLVVLAATVSMTAPAGPHRYDVVSAEFDSEGARVIPMGETETTTHRMGNGGVVPVSVFLETDHEDIEVTPTEARLGARSTANATVSLTAPPRTGYYRRYVVEHRYLAVLPHAHLRALYQLHPWAPIVVIDALLGGAVYLLGGAVVGTGRLRSRETARPSRVGRLLWGRRRR
jgi:signal peptidase